MNLYKWNKIGDFLDSKDGMHEYIPFIPSLAWLDCAALNNNHVEEIHSNTRFEHFWPVVLRTRTKTRKRIRLISRVPLDSISKRVIWNQHGLMIIVVISLMLSNVFCWYVSLMSHFVTSQTSYFFFKPSFLFIRRRFYICLSLSFFLYQDTDLPFTFTNSIVKSMTNTPVPLAPRGENVSTIIECKFLNV